MRWIKHHTDSHRGRSLQNLMDEMGHTGLCYWILVELCGEKLEAVRGQIITEADCLFSFSPRVVRQALRISPTNLRRLLDICQTNDLLSFEFSGISLVIKMPKLLEILEKDVKKAKKERAKKSPDPLLEKNRLEKNREDKDLDKDQAKVGLRLSTWLGPKSENQLSGELTLPKSLTITPDEIVHLWNNSMGKEFGYCPSLGSGKHLTHCLEALNYLQTGEEWLDLFGKARESKFLTGQSDSGWTVTLTWIVNYDNALRVLADEFNDAKAIKNLFSEIKDDGVPA